MFNSTICYLYTDTFIILEEFMELEDFKRKIFDGIGIVFPIMIPLIISFFIGGIQSLWLVGIILVLSFLLAILVLMYIKDKFFFEFFWKINHKKRLRKSVIGIFKEDIKKPTKSKYTYEYWKKLVEDKYETKDISGLVPEQINDDFVAIINPYGECYPEKDMGERTTFKQIKKYVKEGGIFVNVCGAPFWYAWNKDIGQISTAGEVYGQRGKIIPITVNIKNVPYAGQILNIPITHYDVNLQEPTYSPDPVQSLVDTLAFHELRLLTTGGPPRLVKLTQKKKEIDRFGYIPRLGLDRYIFEFRATRKPSQNFKPIARAQIFNRKNPKKPISVFPLAYVPYGKGKFLFTGMHMDLKCSDDEVVILTDDDEEFPISWNNTYRNITKLIIDEQPKMVYEALDTLIEEHKNEYLIRNRRSSQNNRNQNNLQGNSSNSLNCRM